MAKLRVDLVTAERVVFTAEDVDEVIAPGTVGQFTILPEHAAFMSMLEPGEMVIRKGGEETAMAVTGGFLEVRDDRVVILAEAAERSEEIDVARAETARRRAEERLGQREAEMDLVRAQAALQRALIRLRVAEKRRGRQPPRAPGSVP